MRGHRFILAVLLPIAVALPARAGIFSFGKPKGNPAERLSQLIITLKTDRDENRREKAARELRDFDPVANPDIVSVLVDVLQTDSKASVRAEAAQSLGKLRPVSQTVGWALEEATKDASLRVRMQARSSLVSYRISGYRSEPKQAEVPARPEATSRSGFWPFTRSSAPRVAPAVTPQATPSETAPPPLAQPALDAKAKPMPRDRDKSVVAPVAAPKIQKPPAENDAGPDLPPQQ